MNDFKFKDLTDFDHNVIKSMAIDRLVNRPGWDPQRALIEVIFEVIHAKGMNIVKDPTREATMTGPKKSWYEPVKPQNKYWIK